MQKWLAAWFPEEVYGDNGILRRVIFNFGCSCPPLQELAQQMLRLEKLQEREG